MIPTQLAKSNTERGHQTAFFAFCAAAHLYGFEAAHEWNRNGQIPNCGQPVKALRWIHAIHNAGHGDVIRGAAAKAEGVRKGIPDIFLPYPVGNWHGLYIEMKRPDVRSKKMGKGGLSSWQTEFADYAKGVGYGWVVCYGWEHAANIVKEYIEYSPY